MRDVFFYNCSECFCIVWDVQVSCQNADPTARDTLREGGAADATETGGGSVSHAVGSHRALRGVKSSSNPKDSKPSKGAPPAQPPNINEALLIDDAVVSKSRLSVHFTVEPIILPFKSCVIYIFL